MPRHIPIDDLSEFLDLPITSVLATRGPGDTIRLSPVWHEWRDGGFNIVTLEDSEKVRHIRRDPRVSLVVAEQAYPWTGVEIRCEATILSEGVEQAARRIGVRYEGGGNAGDGAPGSLLLRLEPGELRTWDYGEEGE